MKAASEQTIKRLFALSKNRCAFPDCTTAIIQPSGTVTGKVCHIKARRPNGPRYDPKQTDEERNAPENLILLCSVHHDIVDNEYQKYTVELLKSLKETHEQNGVNVQTQDNSDVSKLIDSYLRIEASGEAQVMVGSPGAIQARTINVHAESSPDVSLEFEILIEQWETGKSAMLRYAEPELTAMDFLNIYAVNRKGGLARYVQGSIWIPSVIPRDSRFFVKTPEDFVKTERVQIEFNNKISDIKGDMLRPPSKPEWRPLSPGMRVCLKKIHIHPYRKILTTSDCPLRWQLAVDNCELVKGEIKFCNIPVIDQRNASQP
jgi:hypothetical protein